MHTTAEGIVSPSVNTWSGSKCVHVYTVQVRNHIKHITITVITNSIQAHLYVLLQVW